MFTFLSYLITIIILLVFFIYFGAQVTHLGSQVLFFMETNKYYPIKNLQKKSFTQIEENNLPDQSTEYSNQFFTYLTK